MSGSVFTVTLSSAQRQGVPYGNFQSHMPYAFGLDGHYAAGH